MKKITGLCLGWMLSLALFAQKTINDPNAETRTVSGFHAIKVSNAFDVIITQGSSEGLAVSASTTEYRNKIITTVVNGTLIIRLEDDKKFWKGWNGDKHKFKAYISVKNLDRLSVSGACDVLMEDGIKADDLTIQISGASDLKAKLDVKKLIVDLSGASDMVINGKASHVEVEASGASDFKAFDLTTDFCEARASGASSVSITVNKELNASASGASSVKFKGEGLIRDIKTSGASSVSRKS